jgi:hypothetical protein
VAYILQSGDPGYNASVQHGLIAASSDQTPLGVTKQWYNGINMPTGAVGILLGTGSANTTTIISNQSIGDYAAYLARAYNGGGYSDWYLPSFDELNLLYQNRALIGGFTGDLYWSSSEKDASNARMQYFNTGVRSYTTKNFGLSVRAIRSF